MTVPLWAWAVFLGLVLAMLAVDLFAHRKAHVIRAREAATWSAVWITIGLSFTGAIWWLAERGGASGSEYAAQYLAGFLIEKALAVDNIFVFALIFTYFAVPREYRHRVLFYGVIGAIVFRAIFIAIGATLLERFAWMSLVLGLFLIFTGVKMARHQHAEVHPERNPALRLLRRIIPVTDDYEGQQFLVRRNGVLMATPMMAVLVSVETTDVVFALDSVPAIFAVTSVPFIVFTSNVLAILGLRALYFLLEGMLERFRYLKVGLSVILVFVGVKMILGKEVIPIWVSLGVIAAVLTVSVVVSLLRPVAPQPVDAPAVESGAVESGAPSGSGASPEREQGTMEPWPQGEEGAAPTQETGSRRT